MKEICPRCGMYLSKAAEYHPLALCVLMKATGDEKGARAAIACVLHDGRIRGGARHYRVEVFLEQVGLNYEWFREECQDIFSAPQEPETPRPITSGARLQRLRRALRAPFSRGAA